MRWPPASPTFAGIGCKSPAGWNLTRTIPGENGSFKIGARACDLVTDNSLLTLLQANKFNIGYSDADLNNPDKLVKGEAGNLLHLQMWRSCGRMMKGNQVLPGK
jgi:hypothetical protein